MLKNKKINLKNLTRFVFLLLSMIFLHIKIINTVHYYTGVSSHWSL